MASFVCKKCRDGEHDECRGSNWCDCGHRARAVIRVIGVASSLTLLTICVLTFLREDYPLAGTSIALAGVITVLEFASRAAIRP